MQYLTTSLNQSKENNNGSSLKTSSSFSSPSSTSSIVPVVNTLKGAKKFKTKGNNKSKTVEQIKKISQKQGSGSGSESALNTQKNSPQTTLDIFRSDHLRQLCWCLTHSQVIIRSFAYKVILFYYYCISISFFLLS